jgi:hypothetical protein
MDDLAGNTGERRRGGGGQSRLQGGVEVRGDDRPSLLPEICKCLSSTFSSTVHTTGKAMNQTNFLIRSGMSYKTNLL